MRRLTGSDPDSPLSLASDMDLASCWTPADLAPGTCSVESNEAVCFAFLSHKKPAIRALIWATVCQTSQDSKGYKPLALLYKFIQPSSEF